MADIDPKVLLELQKITSGMNKLVQALVTNPSRSGASSSSRTPASTHARASQSKTKDATRDVKDLAKKLADATTIQLAGSMKDMRKQMEDLNRQTGNTAQEFKKISTAQSAYAQAVMESAEISNRVLDQMTDKIKKTTEGADEFTKSLYASAKSTDDIKQSYQRMSRVMEQYKEIMDETGKKALTDLKRGKELNAALDKLKASFGDMDDNTKKMVAENVAKAKRGNKAALKELEEKMFAIAKTRDLSTKIIETTAVLGPLKTEMTKTWSSFVEATPIAKMLTLGGSFALLSDGVKKLIGQFNALKESGLQGSLFRLNFASIQLGTSVEALGAVMNDNKASLNKGGMGEFISVIKGTQFELVKLGMSTEMAGKFAASIVTSSHDVGIALNSIGEQKDMIAAQSKAYAALRATTNITAEQFVALNKELNNSAAQQDILASMDQRQKINFVKGQALEMERLSTLQLTVDQQKAVIAATNEMLAQTVKGRLDTAAKLQTAAGMLGMSRQGERAAQIERKGRSATTEERAELQTILASLKKRADTLQGGNQSDQITSDNANEILAGTKLFDESRALNNSVDAGNKLSEKQLDQVKENGRLSDVTAKATVLGSQAMSLLSNPLTLIVAGTVGIVKGFLTLGGKLDAIKGAIQGLRGSLGAAAGAAGGAGGRGGIRGKVGGIFDRVSKSGAGKAIGTVGKLAGGAATAFSIGSQLVTPASETDMSSDLLGGGLGIAGAAMLGPVGGAIAAGISGLVGAFKGVQKSGEFFKTDVPTLGQNIASGFGGFLNGVTFGLISGEGAAKTLYSIGDTIGDGFSWAWDKIKSIASATGDAIFSVGKFVMQPYIWLYDTITGQTESLMDNVKSAGKFLRALPKKVFSPIMNMYDSFMKKASSFLSMIGIDTGTTVATSTLNTPAPIASPAPQTVAAIQADGLVGTPVRPVRTSDQTINTQQDAKIASPAQNTATASAPVNTTDADKTIVSSTMQSGKNVTLADVFAKISELVELQKQESGTSKEQLSALKGLKSPNRNLTDLLATS